MELRQLRYFTAVVEEGSLTAAAARLRLSQPSLSVAIGKLEAAVGVALLVRSPRGVEPTSAGRYLLDAASRLLGDVDDVVAALGRFGSGTAGAITMAVVPALTWHRLPALLREHAAAHPEVDVRIVGPPPWTAIDMLQHRKVDLAAIMVADAPRFAHRHRDSFEIVDWGDVPLVAALPPGEHDAPVPMPLQAFGGTVVVLPQRTAAVPSLPERVEEAFRRHGVAPSTTRTVETIQMCLPLIEAGLARAVLPDPDHASLSRFDVTVRRLRPAVPPLRALVLARAGASAEPAVGRLLERIAGRGQAFDSP